ncbi:hypothetical protein GDO81_014766 [Engystomops pustulosus]|uniref:Uncharacterized protein n=1 Tax=Engystomops pustulosus TaxID=76066 RepID=A0AAV7AF84_ENGPU|nr:hypothetical protein GDO81_014766 [Engystomops pustulosus]
MSTFLKDHLVLLGQLFLVLLSLTFYIFKVFKLGYELLVIDDEVPFHGVRSGDALILAFVDLIILIVALGGVTRTSFIVI